MDAFIGEIRAFPFYVPQGWLACDGSKYQINQYQMLFSLIGFIYGGSQAQGYFNVPNLQGRIVTGVSNSDYDFSTVGKIGGDMTAVLTESGQIPPHNHALIGVIHTNAINNLVTNQPSNTTYLTNATSKPASGNPSSIKTYSNGPISTNAAQLNQETVGVTGSSVAHNNMQPYLVFNYCICNDGEYPVRP